MNNFQNMISLLYQGVAAARATLETPKTGFPLRVTKEGTTAKTTVSSTGKLAERWRWTFTDLTEEAGVSEIGQPTRHRGRVFTPSRRRDSRFQDIEDFDLCLDCISCVSLARMMR